MKRLFSLSSVPPFSVSCSYMFVENGAFLEVVCVSTGSQDISSIEYTVNGLQTRTGKLVVIYSSLYEPVTQLYTKLLRICLVCSAVVGSSFRVAGSEFNLENNRIELRLTGDQGTIAPPLTALPLTLGNIIQPGISTQWSYCNLYTPPYYFTHQPYHRTALYT